MPLTTRAVCAKPVAERKRDGPTSDRWGYAQFPQQPATVRLFHALSLRSLDRRAGAADPIGVKRYDGTAEFANQEKFHKREN